MHLPIHGLGKQKTVRVSELSKATLDRVPRAAHRAKGGGGACSRLKQQAIAARVYIMGLEWLRGAYQW